MGTRTEIKEELELAEMMVNDLQRLWNSYAKKALVAKQERELKQDKKGFLDYDTEAELIEGYGWGSIDEETYRRGLDYFENLKAPPKLSVIEQHRNKIKGMLNNWKGTVKELQEELNPVEKRQQENAFQKRERELREERIAAMM